jgi:SpoVK/Ycf46/Vps4 family AAA+-type ATPase
MAQDGNNADVDLVQLARIALSGRTQDVQVLLHRIAKRSRESSPALANQITELLREAPTRASPLRRETQTALPVDLDTRFQLIKVEEIPILDHEPVFTPEILSSLTHLVGERANLKALLDEGLEPTRTTLFTGPPGVGKTMAARWIARELGRPLLILDLAAVMSSFLGRTGTNLRHVLDYAKSIDCVLLLDELDAIAKRRDDKGEIGELKRLVTVLIQQIDDWPSTGLLIAATNHAELLDPAIWRRFELTVQFPLPSQETAATFITHHLKGKSVNAGSWANILAIVMQGKSYSDIERELKTARRSAALSGGGLEDQLIGLIRSGHLGKQTRIKLAASLVKSGVVTQRRARELTGVARDTIRDRTASSGEMEPT